MTLQALGIGEVLWDVFPEGARLGGAPFNFAYFCGRLGAAARIVSRVGADEQGRALLDEARRMGVDTSLIQIDNAQPTGIVRVSIGSDGVPAYECPAQTAWDFIETTESALEAARQADIIGFGTLAQRHNVSWRTIHRLLAEAKAECLRVCDVNLRHQYYSPEFLTESFLQAEIVKLNEDEFALVKQLLGTSPQDDEAAQWLVEEFDLRALVLTLGPHGARAWSTTTQAQVGGLVVRVRDTVGSGDAFAATFAMEMARGSSLETALFWANVAGAYVATQHGATPEFSWEILRGFARP